MCMWRRVEGQRLQGRFEGVSLMPGDTVQLSLPERYLLYGSVIIYGLPLAGLLVGALAGSILIEGDAGTFFGAIAGIGAIFVLTPSMRRCIERIVLGKVAVNQLP